jgi:hypothetical protein
VPQFNLTYFYEFNKFLEIKDPKQATMQKSKAYQRFVNQTKSNSNYSDSGSGENVLKSNTQASCISEKAQRTVLFDPNKKFVADTQTFNTQDILRSQLSKFDSKYSLVESEFPVSFDVKAKELVNYQESARSQPLMLSSARQVSSTRSFSQTLVRRDDSTNKLTFNSCLSDNEEIPCAQKQIVTLSISQSTDDWCHGVPRRTLAELSWDFEQDSSDEKFFSCHSTRQSESVEWRSDLYTQDLSSSWSEHKSNPSANERTPSFMKTPSNNTRDNSQAKNSNTKN